MWLLNVIIVSSIFFIGFSLGQTPSHEPTCNNGHSGRRSSKWTSVDDESSLPNGGSCSRQTSDEDTASSVIRNLYSTIDQAVEDLANPADYPPDYRLTDEEEFDFVVVGAGSAGAVVANRLSENPSWTVLLIEAGGNPTKSSELPGLAMSMQLTDVDWQYKSEPDGYSCLGMVNKSCNLPRGKVLGGSSILNYMEYVRGNAKDYDNWAAMGNNGWSYEDVLHYFKKSEDMRDPRVWEETDAEKYHGKGGYLKVEPWTPSNTDPLLELFGKGLGELGVPLNVDCNGKTHVGFTRFQGTLENQKRCSSAKAFLSPVKDRNNLKVSKHSLVTKVLINKEMSKAYGVELTNKEGNRIKILTKKEVVLSAGAINTPQILLLSGVGPKEHLKEMGVPVIKDLPVGENLQDHPFMNNLVMTVNTSFPKIDLKRNMLKFLTEGSGDMTNQRGLSYAAFINTVTSEDFPDMELIPIHAMKNDPDLSQMFSLFNYKDEILQEYQKINKFGDSVHFLVSLLRPYSRGKILLRSTDPKHHVKIFLRTLSDIRDVETLLRSYDLMERWVETKALKSVSAKLHEVRVPDCLQHPLGSREYRECALRHLVATTYHYCCSCKMGPASDPAAVVDPELRVRGLAALRVADASVMPCEVSGNINAAVVMIGEKAADLVMQSWT